MITMLTIRRRIALVMAGLTFCVSTVQAAPVTDPSYTADSVAAVPALVSFDQALAQQTQARASTEPSQAIQELPKMIDRNGEIVSLEDDADGTINIFELAQELEQAVRARQAEEDAPFSALQNFAEATNDQRATDAILPISGEAQTKVPFQLPNTALSAPVTTVAQTPQNLVAPAAANSNPQDNLPPALRQQQQQQQATQPQEVTEQSVQAQARAIAKIKKEAELMEQAYIQSVRDEAYRRVELEAFPMTPDQIQKLHEKLDETQRAQEAHPSGTPPKPVSTSLIVNLSPGTTPPVIRLGKGFVSSLVFVDATGSPWPILSYDVGAPDVFNIQWDKDSNMLLIQALRTYTYGNIAVNLVGLNTPVMITLTPGQKEIDYRVDLRVQALGPNPNQQLLGDGLPMKASAVLLGFLNGAAPDAARQLTVSGSYTQAWVFNEHMYVRSRFKVISPSWLASMTSADGTHVYELPKTPILLLSRHGKIVTMKLEGF